MEIKHLIQLFEKHQQKNLTTNLKPVPTPTQRLVFATRQELLEYQRAILVQKLSTKHYDLLNLLFRNVFDFYQKSCHFAGDEEQDEEVYAADERLKGTRKNLLIENFESINRIIFELDLFDHLCGDIMVGVVQNKIRLHIESTSIDNYQVSFIKSFELVSDKINC